MHSYSFCGFIMLSSSVVIVYRIRGFVISAVTSSATRGEVVERSVLYYYFTLGTSICYYCTFWVFFFFCPTFKSKGFFFPLKNTELCAGGGGGVGDVERNDCAFHRRRRNRMEAFLQRTITSCKSVDRHNIKII